MPSSWPAAALFHALPGLLQASSDFDVFNLDDVDAAFALFQPLRYQQNIALRWVGGRSVGRQGGRVCSLQPAACALFQQLLCPPEPHNSLHPTHPVSPPPCSGKGEGIVLTPFAAGHLLGGTVWRICKAGEDYVYAVDYNHRCAEQRVVRWVGLPAALQLI